MTTFDSFETFETHDDPFATDAVETYEPFEGGDPFDGGVEVEHGQSCCCCPAEPVVVLDSEPALPAVVEAAYVPATPVDVALAPLAEAPVAAAAAAPVELPLGTGTLVGGSHFDAAITVDAPLSAGSLVGGTVVGAATLVEAPVSTGSFVGGTFLGAATPIEAPLSTGNLVGGETAAFAAYQAASREVEAMGSVRHLFTDNAPGTFQGPIPAPGLAEYQIRKLYEAMTNTDQTIIYGSRITNPYL